MNPDVPEGVLNARGPIGLRALLDDRGRQYCPACVKKEPAFLDQEDIAVALNEDWWYRGGECYGCGEEIKACV